MRRNSVPLLACVAVGGAGVMAVELAAVRLLAPWFGTSLSVWTNVIGVVLLALALGYLWGARQAGVESPVRRMGWHLLAGGLLTAWLPAFAAPVADWLLPAELSLDQAGALFTWGSLAASLALFMPPALLLGAVGPLALESIQRRSGARAGAAGGQVLAFSTLGSLAGTFATTHALVPELGLRLSFLVVGACLGFTGVLALVLSRPQASRRTGALCLLALGLAATPVGGLNRPEPGSGRVLAEVESHYQWLRVVERGDRASGSLERQLQVNEGLDSYQSLWRPRMGLLGAGEFYYYDPFALPAWWSRASGPWRVLVLGLGAGTAVRVLRGASPDSARLRVTGVELDPEVVALGSDYMELPTDDPSLTIHAGLDARASLRGLPGPYEQVIVDCYANQFEIPPHLATVEFFRDLKERLSPGGWLAVNVGGFGLDDPVVEAVAQTVATAFAEPCHGFAVPASRNVVLYARQDLPIPDPGSPEWAIPGPCATLLQRLELPAHRRIYAPGGDSVLSDDRSGMEQLQLRSIREGRARMRGAL